MGASEAAAAAAIGSRVSLKTCWPGFETRLCTRGHTNAKYLCPFACSTFGETSEGTLFTSDSGLLVLEINGSSISDSKV